MASFPKVVLACVISLLFCTSAKTAFLTKEHSLFTHLLDGYNKNIRPTLQPIATINVSIDMSLNQIIDFDVRKQQLTTTIWMRQFWTDAHMRWNVTEYGGIKEISLTPDLIWTPDITLYNDVSENKNGADYMGNYMVQAASDGAMKWLAPLVISSSCSLDVTYFPWDIQHCYLRYGSWMYDAGSLDLFNVTNEVDLAYYIEHGEWELVKATIRRQNDMYPCCPHAFPTVFFEFTLKRMPMYFIMNVIMPCIFITVTALLSFCLPPDSGEKISLAVTILLATTVFLLVINESMPVQSVVFPYIARYFMAVLGILSLSTCMSVHVLCVHHNGQQGQRVPLWAKTVFFRVIGPVVGLRSTLDRHGREDDIGHGSEKSKPHGNKVGEGETVGNNFMKEHHPESDNIKEVLSVQSMHGQLSTLHKIRVAVENIKIYFQEQKEEENSKTEWILLALILDRLYFLVSLVLIITCCVALLIHRPVDY